VSSNRYPVLVVDDEPSIRWAVTRALEPTYEVVAADSGTACLDVVRKGFRGLVFLDIMMPEMTGWQTIAKLRDADLLAGNTICILSGVPHPERGAGELGVYVDRYIGKPFRRDELLRIVAEVAAAQR